MSARPKSVDVRDCCGGVLRAGLVEGAGHRVQQQEQPEAVSRLLLQFLRSGG